MSKSKNEKIVTLSDQAEMEAWIGFTEAASDDSEDEAAQLPARQSLRPQGFSDYIGQERIKQNIQIACQAAKNRGEALDHVLLHGPPGLGKTSLARIIASELGVGFKSTSGPVIERPGDLAAILTTLEPNDVLFIDEIHRLPRISEEVLYPALEDFELDIVIGQGPAAKSVKVELKPFTLIGATTRTGLLTSPLRDRFGIAERLEFYSINEMLAVVQRSAGLLGMQIDLAACLEIGQRSRGTPRIGNRLLRRVRDFADANKSTKITVEVAQGALSSLDIDTQGLDRTDRQLLLTIIDKFAGGPVGVDTIAAALGEERATIEDVYEPYLLQEGFLARTRRGREATARAYELFGRPAPLRAMTDSAQQDLSLFPE